jgi:hypothetical protein
MLVLDTAAGVQYLPDIHGKQSAILRDVAMPGVPLGFIGTQFVAQEPCLVRMGSLQRAKVGIGYIAHESIMADQV